MDKEIPSWHCTSGTHKVWLQSETINKIYTIQSNWQTTLCVTWTCKYTGEGLYFALPFLRRFNLPERPLVLLCLSVSLEDTGRGKLKFCRGRSTSLLLGYQSWDTSFLCWEFSPLDEQPCVSHSSTRVGIGLWCGEFVIAGGTPVDRIFSHASNLGSSFRGSRLKSKSSLDHASTLHHRIVTTVVGVSFSLLQRIQYSRDYKQKYINFRSKLGPRVSAISLHSLTHCMCMMSWCTIFGLQSHPSLLSPSVYFNEHARGNTVGGLTLWI